MSFNIVSRNRNGFFPIVETPCHLVQIGCKMLRADLMPRTHDAAREQAESGLYAICVKVSDNILLRAMVHNFLRADG